MKLQFFFCTECKIDFKRVGDRCERCPSGQFTCEQCFPNTATSLETTDCGMHFRVFTTLINKLIRLD